MKLLAIIISSSLLLTGISTEKDWTLRKEQSGIQVYTAPVEGSDFRAFRAVMTIKSDLTSLVAALYDVENHYQWMPNISSSSLLANHSGQVLIAYTIAKAPWPVTDRDGVYEFRYTYQADDGSVIARISATPDKETIYKDKVRIEYAEGYWKFTPQSNGMVEVVYELHTDPNGSIPSWLANSVVVDTPLETMKGIREQSGKQQYQDQSFSFIP